jgi:hypothetical protein
VSSSTRRDLPTGSRPAPGRLTGSWFVDRAAWLLPLVTFAFVSHQLWTQTYFQRLDFHIYFEAVSGWTRSTSIYDYAEVHTHLGFTYPPFAAVVLWPLTHLDVGVAEHVWMMASLAASAAFLVIAGRALPSPPQWRWFTRSSPPAADHPGGAHHPARPDQRLPAARARRLPQRSSRWPPHRRRRRPGRSGEADADGRHPHRGRSAQPCH